MTQALCPSSHLQVDALETMRAALIRAREAVFDDHVTSYPSEYLVRLRAMLLQAIDQVEIDLEKEGWKP